MEKLIALKRELLDNQFNSYNNNNNNNNNATTSKSRCRTNISV